LAPEKSYSLRIGLSADLIFFIASALSATGASRADQPDIIASVGMDDNETDVSSWFVDFTPVADIMKQNAALSCVEFIQDSIVADSQLEFGSALKSLMRELFQSNAHLIQLALNCGADRLGKRIERFGERCRPNLEGSRHRLFWVTRRVLPGGDFAPGLVELGFDVVVQLKLLLEVIVNPFADRLDFSAR
jgi:hypothetical protein